MSVTALPPPDVEIPEGVSENTEQLLKAIKDGTLTSMVLTFTIDVGDEELPTFTCFYNRDGNYLKAIGEAELLKQWIVRECVGGDDD